MDWSLEHGTVQSMKKVDIIHDLAKKKNSHAMSCCEQ